MRGLSRIYLSGDIQSLSIHQRLLVDCCHGVKKAQERMLIKLERGRNRRTACPDSFRLNLGVRRTVTGTDVVSREICLAKAIQVVETSICYTSITGIPAPDPGLASDTTESASRAGVRRGTTCVNNPPVLSISTSRRFSGGIPVPLPWTFSSLSPGSPLAPSFSPSPAPPDSDAPVGNLPPQHNLIRPIPLPRYMASGR